MNFGSASDQPHTTTSSLTASHGNSSARSFGLRRSSRVLISGRSEARSAEVVAAVVSAGPVALRTEGRRPRLSASLWRPLRG